MHLLTNQLIITWCIEALAFSFTLEELSLIVEQSTNGSHRESLALLMRALIVKAPSLPPILPVSYILENFHDDLTVRDSICAFSNTDFDVMGKLINLIFPMAPGVELPVAIYTMPVDEMYATGFDKSSYETYVEEERAIDAEYIPTYTFDDEHLEFEDVPAGTKWVFIRLILPKTPSLPILRILFRFPVHPVRGRFPWCARGKRH